MDSVSQTLREGFQSQNATLKQLMFLAGLNESETLKLLQISRATFYRWERNGKPDPMASKLLSIMAGYLPWPDWYGWEIHGAHLFRPGQSRRGLTSLQIENTSIAFQLNDALLDENQKLKEELSHYKQKQKAPVLRIVQS